MPKIYIQIHTADPIQFAAVGITFEKACEIARFISHACGEAQWDVEQEN